MHLTSLSAEASDQLVRLLRVLFFSGYCRAGRIPPDSVIHVAPRDFCEWVDRNIADFTPEKCIEAADVPMSIWEMVVGMVVNPNGVHTIETIWYDVILGQREPNKHEIANLNIVCNITYADGKIATSQCFIDKAAITPSKFTDGYVATLVVNNVKALVVDTVTQGLDNLHDRLLAFEYRAPDGTDPYDALMGAILTKAVGSLPVGQQMAAMNYVRLIQRCIRPPYRCVTATTPVASVEVPAKPSAEPSTEPRGGWED